MLHCANTLERHGWIKRAPGTPRSIQILAKLKSTVSPASTDHCNLQLLERSTSVELKKVEHSDLSLRPMDHIRVAHLLEIPCLHTAIHAAAWQSSGRTRFSILLQNHCPKRSQDGRHTRHWFSKRFWRRRRALPSNANPQIRRHLYSIFLISTLAAGLGCQTPERSRILAKHR